MISIVSFVFPSVFSEMVIRFLLYKLLVYIIKLAMELMFVEVMVDLCLHSILLDRLCVHSKLH